MNDQTMIAGETAFVPLEKIRLRPNWPYRKEVGSLDGLERSMSGNNGQLQAIGIDTSGFLVWGLRRFHAAKELGWTNILCRIVDLADPLTAMKEENENRLDLTPSEMTAIMRCIEADEKAKGKERQRLGGEGKEIFPDPSEAGQSRDKAAAAFDLSGKTFDAMKFIEDHGTEALRDAWNAKEISTHDAASAAAEPGNIQDEAIKRVREKKARTIQAAVQEIKAEKEAEMMVDDDDRPVPAKLRHIFASVESFRSLASSIQGLATKLQKAEQTPAYQAAVQDQTDDFRLSSANFMGAKKFRDIRPALVHQSCGGAGCEKCKGNGYLTAEERGETE